MTARLYSGALPPAVATNMIEHIVEMVGLNEPDFLADLLETFINEADRLIPQMSQALDDGDLDIVGRTAHSMKSSSATFCAHHMSQLCQDLEMAVQKGEQYIKLAQQIDEVQAEYLRVREALVVEKSKLLA